MKKLLSLALALVICLGLAVPALAINVPGDTGVSDSKSNIFQLSNPILYTFSAEAARTAIDWDSAKVINVTFEEQEMSVDAHEYINSHFWSGIDTVYAIPSGTDIVFPDGYWVLDETEMIVSSKDNSYYSDTVYYFEATYDIINEHLERPDEHDSLFHLRVRNYLGAGEDADIAFYITTDPSAPNPFANVKVPETPAEPEPPAGVAFTDVAADAFYAAPVAWAVEKNITKGTGATTFSPNGTCKIEQILTFLWRAAGSPESTAPCPFAGLEQSSPYYPALCWAGEKGILKDEATAAGKDCTRIMAVEFMYRYAGSPESTTRVGFMDVPGGHMPAVLWAVDNGVTNGTGGGNFSPDRTCTRGEIVTFLFRAFSEK